MERYAYKDLIDIMRKKVNAHVNHFKADAGYDYETLRRDMNAGKDVSYIWILRDCGTFLLPVRDSHDAARANAAIAYYDAVREAFPAKNRTEYMINLSGSTFSIRPRTTSA